MAKIEATGNLGQDPEVRFSPSGRAVLSMSICDSKSRKDQSGNWETVAEQWIRVSLWGDQAEYWGNLLHKGDRVTVWGEFYAKEFDRRDGTRGTGLEVNAFAIQHHPKRDQSGGGGYTQRPAPAASGGGWGTPATDPGGWGAAPDSNPPF